MNPTNTNSNAVRSLEGPPMAQLFQVATFHETRLKRIEQFLATIVDDNGDFHSSDTESITVLENGMNSVMQNISDIRTKQVALERQVNKKSRATSTATTAIISEQLRLLSLEVNKLKENMKVSLVITEEEEEEEEEESEH
jgi:hypothetical protein